MHALHARELARLIPPARSGLSYLPMSSYARVQSTPYVLVHREHGRNRQSHPLQGQFMLCQKGLGLFAGKDAFGGADGPHAAST